MVHGIQSVTTMHLLALSAVPRRQPRHVPATLAIRAVCVAVFSLVYTSIAGCGDGDPIEDAPRYSNDMGEEIFGPGYRPTSPTIESVPLKVGYPNAGYNVRARLRNRSHDEILAPPDEPAAAGAGDDSALPLLRKFAGRSVADPGTIEAADGEEETGDEDIDLPDELLDSEDAPVMTIHYVFVGQGDGAIVEFPCGVAVIDTGGEFGGGTRVDGGQKFVDYLREFFADRPQLNDTIDVVFTTHPHADHLNGLPLLVDDEGELLFTIRNVVDNGQTADSGSLGKQTTFRRRVVDGDGGYSAVELSRQVAATGATNHVIDPFQCENVDPIITAFWGGLNDELPEDELLSMSEYSNPNNHSVVVRIDFGDASFLFTGDLEDRGEEDMREQYADNLEVFDVDVYQVSHHGADDDTSDALLEIMTPKVAVISMGTQEHEGSHTAFDHGHPRVGLLAVLQEEPGVISDFRDTAVEFPAAAAQDSPFQNVLIERAIFGTGWEGTIVIEANTLGEYDISTE